MVRRKLSTVNWIALGLEILGVNASIGIRIAIDSELTLGSTACGIIKDLVKALASRDSDD
jgi:hypothetical protein